MKYFDLTLPTPEGNLACDEALLDLCDEGGDEVLRFWEPPDYFVVLGYANQAATEVNLPVCEARGIRVLRRCSGGGTVLQGPGCLNYSLVLRMDGAEALGGICGTNRHVLERQRDALQPLAPGRVEVRGVTDLAIGGLKFSGNAQRRKRHALIFHGTFLLKFDVGLIEAVLRAPSKEPDYRQGRTHREFVTNFPATSDSVKAALRAAWQATAPLEQVPGPRIEELVRTKYSTREWNLKF